MCPRIWPFRGSETIFRISVSEAGLCRDTIAARYLLRIQQRQATLSISGHRFGVSLGIPAKLKLCSVRDFK